MKRKFISFVVPKSATDELDAGTLDDQGTDSTTLTDDEALDALLNDDDDQTDDDAQLSDDEQAQIAAAEAAKATKRRTAQEQQQYAFGAMRTQNKQLSDTLLAIAKAQGIDTKDVNEATKQLREISLTQRAEKEKVPKEYLEKIEQLTSTAEQFKLEKAQLAAERGFTQLVKDYDLDEESLMDFARELDEAGTNPFVVEMDVVAAYKIAHIDDIIAKRTAKAVEDALKRSGAADQHSSTPSKTKGVGGGAPEKITTQDGLSALLANI